MSGMRTEALRKAVKNYCAGMAKSFNVETTSEYFEVSVPKETKLKEALMASAEMLKRINFIDVEQTEGQAVTVGKDQLSTGRVKKGRFAGTTPGIDGNTYKLKKTDSKVQMEWERVAIWLNAGKQGEFNKLLTKYANDQFAADLIRVGWNGTHAAEETDPEQFPNGEDVNEGWHARVKRLSPAQVVTANTSDDIIYFDPDGTKDADGKPLYDYKTVDAMASDLKNNNLHERYREAHDLVVLIGRDLVAAQQYKLYTEADKPSEHMAAQKLDQSIAGMPAYVPPYFPGNRLVVTTWANLSIYNQKGNKRRKVKDNDDAGCVESSYWRMEDYMVEDLEKYAAFDENAIVIGSKDIAPPAPAITTEPQDASVAIGDTASFTVAADNADSFSWTLDGTDLGESSDSCAIDTTGKAAGDYTVEVTAIGEGGSVKASATLTVTEPA